MDLKCGILSLTAAIAFIRNKANPRKKIISIRARKLQDEDCCWVVNRFEVGKGKEHKGQRRPVVRFASQQNKPLTGCIASCMAFKHIQCFLSILKVWTMWLQLSERRECSSTAPLTEENLIAYSCTSRFFFIDWEIYIHNAFKAQIWAQNNPIFLSLWKNPSGAS